MIKSLSILFAFFALLNSVDVHALSHIIDGDNHNEIENCEICEEFVVVADDEVFITPTIAKYNCCNFNLSESPLLLYSQNTFIYQENHLGKYYNKPPPFTI